MTICVYPTSSVRSWPNSSGRKILLENDIPIYTCVPIWVPTERGDDTDRSVVGGDMTVSFIIIKLPLSASLSYPLEIPFFYLAVPFLASSSYCRRSQQTSIADSCVEDHDRLPKCYKKYYTFHRSLYCKYFPSFHFRTLDRPTLIFPFPFVKCLANTYSD
jgi:hypothetical protein